VRGEDILKGRRFKMLVVREAASGQPKAPGAREASLTCGCVYVVNTLGHYLKGKHTISVPKERIAVTML